MLHLKGIKHTGILLRFTVQVRDLLFCFHIYKDSKLNFTLEPFFEIPRQGLIYKCMSPSHNSNLIIKYQRCDK